MDAIEQYLLAIELDDYDDIRFRVGRLLYDYPEASSQLEVVVNSNPANVVARELLGDTFREQGMAERALRQYRRVLEQAMSVRRRKRRVCRCMILNRLDRRYVLSKKLHYLTIKIPRSSTYLGVLRDRTN